MNRSESIRTFVSCENIQRCSLPVPLDLNMSIHSIVIGKRSLIMLMKLAGKVPTFLIILVLLSDHL